MNPVEPYCQITLYQIDARDEKKERTNVCKKSFTKITAQKANDFITSYLSPIHEWDTKLINSIFSDKTLDWFEFKRIDVPYFIFGVLFDGDKEIFLKRQDFYAPIEKSLKLIRSYASPFTETVDILDYELIRIRKETGKEIDYSIAPLFNSESFISIAKVWRTCGLIISFEKLDVETKPN
jgi:hypothetical protein